MTGYYIDELRERPELDLDEAVTRVYDTFPSDFTDFWGLDSATVPEDQDPDRWEQYRRLNQLAQRLVSLADALVRPRRLRDAELQAPLEMREASEGARDLLRAIVEQLQESSPDAPRWEVMNLRITEDVEYRFFLACLQIHASPRFTIEPGQVAERIVDLTQYAARVKNDRAISYLARVSRCYLWNMPAELAVMSRAVLEVLLEDLIPEPKVRELRGIPRHRRVGLSDYLAVAEQQELLPEEALEAARAVKQFGDDAVHLSAEAVGNPSAVLEKLVTVLRSLEG